MTTEMNIATLVGLLESADLLGRLERGIGDGSAVRERYSALKMRLTAKTLLMPVFGVQGTGKSTLLNALLFDRPVLPVDADETTCIPVEVVYAHDGVERARVCFRDGREEELPEVNEASLARYVHNGRNPGNGLAVRRLVVSSKSELLASGLVLVDLPGTGSLTAANVETTRLYLEEAIGVLYMLRTVPPLTRSESIAVAGSWAKTPTAVFVQNRWTDESDAEVAAGREHNEFVLAELAKRHRIPLPGRVTVLLVDAYSAHKARLQGASAGLETSGLLRLAASLSEVSVGWRTALADLVRAILKADLDAAVASIQVRLSDLSASREAIEAALLAEQRRFETYYEDLERKCAEARAELERVGDVQRSILQQWSVRAKQELRNAMRTKMRAGIVDGPRLERALRDEQAEYLDDIYGTFQQAMLEAQDSLQPVGVCATAQGSSLPPPSCCSA